MSFTRMRYHFVFATHKRKRFIDEQIEDFLYPVIRRHFRLNDGAVVAIGGIEDHVHIVAGVHPKAAMSNVLKIVKRDSAKAVRRNFKKCRSFKWQEGFSGFTVKPYDMQDLIDYVENQKEHHHNDTLRKEFEILLEKFSQSAKDKTRKSEDAEDAEAS